MLLDVVLKEGKSLRLLTVVLNNAGRASSNLSGDTGLVVLGLTEPLSKLISGVDLDEWDLVLLGKSGNELLVLWIVTVGGEDTEVGILSVEGLSDLVESLNET